MYKMVEEGFVKGSSDNLPFVDVDMIDEFYLKCMSELATPESRHVKTKRFYIIHVTNDSVQIYFFRSTRASYGDNAIGYVQLKRLGSTCTVKAKITPEHKVRAKYYNVICEIDEEKKEINKCDCTSCAASSGKY